MENFDEDTTQTKHQHWSKLRVAQATDNYFLPLYEFLDAYAQNLCRGLFTLYCCQHLLEYSSNLCWQHPDSHPAGIRLVADVGRNDFQHTRFAQRLPGCDSPGGIRAYHFAWYPCAIGCQEGLHLVFKQYSAILCASSGKDIGRLCA